MSKRITIVSLLAVILVLSLTGVASAAGPERRWVSAYTHDLPAGILTSGSHTWEYDWAWIVPTPGGSSSTVAFKFNVDPDAPLYRGWALLRLGTENGIGAVLVRDPAGGGCIRVNTINPGQPVRFLVGWVTDDPMTRLAAQAHYASLAGAATLDATPSVDLEGSAILPYNEATWGHYACTWTLR